MISERVAESASRPKLKPQPAFSGYSYAHRPAHGINFALINGGQRVERLMAAKTTRPGLK
ncbi:MAG TPA: hypothetical protein VKC61_00035 [Pyrinomonadaceae bacterium]|nr:hypothetical protein [Pyrinomonadaceae bacterium]